VTALLDAPPAAPATGRPPAPRTVLLAVTALASAGVALMVVAALAAAPRMVRIDPVTPAFSGSAPQVTLPTYGLQGMHVVGYEHGATTRMTLPISNGGVLPLTVTSVSLGGGVAPLLELREVVGLPLDVPAGETRSFEVVAQLGNCKFFHEREVQNYPSLEVGFTVLGQAGTRTVPYDRPLMVHSPMIVGCPDRTLDRQQNDRTDLTRAG
jgi:hypothetical protein